MGDNIGFGYMMVMFCAFFGFTASEQCEVSSTVEQFMAYVSNFPACRIPGGYTRFQDEIQIINQVFDDNGDFYKDGFKQDELETYCSNVQECKSKVSACQSTVNDFVKSAGAALCQNGLAMTQDIDDALTVLSKTNCELYGEPKGLPNDGCHLSDPNARPPTYLMEIQRETKKRAATSRCMSRYTEEQGYCPSDVIAALATLSIASQPLQFIGTNFNLYTSYSKPGLSKDHTTLSLRGFAHLYKNGKKVESCIGLKEDNVLLWNTYLRIDGTYGTLSPMSDRTVLTGVFIQFSDDVGRVLDTYMSYSSTDAVLSKKTSHQISNQKTSIKLEVINDNLIVLSHSGVDTKIAISRVDEGLSVIVSMPSSLLELETLGALVEGCTTYGGTVVSNFAAQANSTCKDSCTSESQVEQVYRDECAYDCTHGIVTYVNVYNNIDEQSRAVEPDVNGAVHQSASTPLLAFLLLLTIYLQML